MHRSTARVAAASLSSIVALGALTAPGHAFATSHGWSSASRLQVHGARPDVQRFQATIAHSRSSVHAIGSHGISWGFFSTTIRTPTGVAEGPDNALWFTNAADNPLGTLTP